MRNTNFTIILLLVATVATAVACKRDDRGSPNGSPNGPTNPAPDTTEQGSGNQQGSSATTSAGPAESVPPPGAATLTDPNRPFGHDPVAWLDSKYQLELPRSTAPDPAPLPWMAITPTAPPAPVADVHNAPPEPVHQWTQPVVLIGRQALVVAAPPAADQEIAKVACQADPATLCQAEGLRAPTGKQVLTLDAAAVAPLQGALVGQTGKRVWLLADRRLNTAAVVQAMQAIRQAGAEPILGVATLAGVIAQLMPTGALADPVDRKPQPPPEPGQSGSVGPVPADLTAVEVHVARTGVHLVFKRSPPNEAVTPELLGNVAEALAVWAERARSSAPALDSATVLASPDAPWEEVARAIDALRDTCARANKGTPCHDKRPLFGHIALALDVSPTQP